jgi:phage shock protein E
MRRGVLLLLLLLVAAAAGACGDGAGDFAAEDALFLDVRTAEEFAEGHVAGATLIPYDQLQTRWREIEAYRDRPVVVYCRTGRRSAIAVRVLQQQGFTKLYDGGGLTSVVARFGLQTAR